MSAIKSESIFFYRSFLCWWDRRGSLQLRCPVYGYTYVGKGEKEEAKEKVDYFLRLRADKADRQNS